MSLILKKHRIQYPWQEKPKHPNCPKQQVPPEAIFLLIGKYELIIGNIDHKTKAGFIAGADCLFAKSLFFYLRPIEEMNAGPEEVIIRFNTQMFI